GGGIEYGGGSEGIEVSNCLTLDQEGANYLLTSDIVNSTFSYCIDITAPNIVFDCQGHTINGSFNLNGASEDNKYAIYSNQLNTTIKNCVITNWQTGIYFDTGADNGNIDSNTIQDLYGTRGSTVSDQPGGLGGTAVGIYSKSLNNTISNNVIKDLIAGTGGIAKYGDPSGTGGISTGIYLSASSGNSLHSNTIFNLTGGAGGADTGQGSGGTGGISTGIYLSFSNSNTLTSNSISNLISGIGGATGCNGSDGSPGASAGVWLDINSYNNIVTLTIIYGSDNVPDSNKLNTIDGKPILYFYDQSNLNISNFNIEVSTIPMLIGGSIYSGDTGGISTGLAFINITDSIVENNIIANFEGMSGSSGLFSSLGGVGGISAGIYLLNSESNAFSANTVSNLTGGTGGAGGCYDGGGTGGISTGIYLSSSNGDTFSANTVSNLTGGTGGAGGFYYNGGTGGISTGIYLSSSNGDTFSSNIISSLAGGMGGVAGYSTGSPGGTGISYAMHLLNAGESSANLIYNNLFNNTNHIGFGGTIYTNHWNIAKQTGTRIYGNGPEIGGNYWTNPSGNGYSDNCVDSNTDGFCDNPYTLNADNADNLSLSGDYIP
ncbi:hypothetical protein KAS79_04100, partial [Candidatus Parcubacteria bacterium]|nr:hypothetical protein [Candidatus Parcubacteria bacterium]